MARQKKAPQILGWLLAASSGASLLTFGTIAIIYSHFDFTYKQMYIYCGSITIFLAVIAFIFWPKYPTAKTNNKEGNYKKSLLALLCFTVYLWSKTANIFCFRCIYAS